MHEKLRETKEAKRWLAEGAMGENIDLILQCFASNENVHY